MSIRVGTAIFLVLALTLVPAGTVATTAVAPDAVMHGTSDGVHGGDHLANTGENTLTRTTTFALRPSEPGTVRAEVVFSIPDQVVELETGVPGDATVVARDGVRAVGDGNYSWDERTARPSITLSLQVNRTGTYHQRPVATGERGLMFADTGDWAIASVPSAPVWWSSLRSEPPVSFARETAVEGAGVAGDRMAYLGPHTSRTRTIDGQEITLVVPEAARLEAAPDAIFESLSTAATGLPASPVPESLVIAAPTAVDWGPYGLADGSDTWVRADQPLDVPGNVWIHEFVHLRQDFRTTAETRWIREGMPEYYAALFTLEAGHIDFDEFAAHLDRGTRTRYEDSVLADPDSWTGLANYAKGALVYGDLDRRIRTASEGGAAALQVFAAMNEQEGPVDQAFLASHIRAVSDAETVSAFEAATTTTATPDPWSLDAHRDAFGTAPPKLTTTVADPIRVTGPYRNQSASTIPTLVPGERVTIPLTVSNEGDASGEFDLQLEANGRAVDSANGTLDGGATTIINLSHQVATRGEVELAVGSHRWPVTVTEPTAPVASDLSVHRTTVAVGETVRVTAQFENQERVPANGTAVLTVEGVAVTKWPIRLDVGETSTRSAEVAISESGDHRIVVGTQTVIVEGVAPTTSDPPTVTDTPATGTTATETPGFGGLTAAIAILVLAGLLGARGL
jgi:hypothetical protein